jgi:hypothetical protein
MKAHLLVLAAAGLCTGCAWSSVPRSNQDEPPASSTKDESGVLAGPTTPPSGDARWAILSVGTDTPWIDSMAVDADGSVVTLARFRGSMDFGAGFVASKGGDDLVVTKIAKDGKPLFSRTIGGCGAEESGAVAIAPDHAIYVFAAITFGGSSVCEPRFAGKSIAPGAQSGTRPVLLRYAPDGSELAARTYGDDGNGVLADSIAVDAQRVAFAGTTLTKLDFGGGASAGQSFVAVTDRDGNGLWSRELGTNTQRSRVAFDGPRLVVAGTFSSSTDVGAGTRLVAFGSKDVVLARYASDGSYVGHAQLGGTGADEVKGLSVDATSIQIAGSFAETAHFGGSALTTSAPFDGWAARFGTNGAPIASYATGSDRGAVSNGIAAMPDGGAVIVGWFGRGSTPVVGSIRRNDAAGNALWSHELPGEARVIARAPDGDLLVAGLVDGGATLALQGLPTPLVNGAVTWRAFVARLAP